jgi:hypothetical protein
MTDEMLTNLAAGSVMLLLGGFIAISPHRFLHPFKGKSVHHAKGAMTFMRVCGTIVCIGGIRFTLSGLWAIFNVNR